MNRYSNKRFRGPGQRDYGKALHTETDHNGVVHHVCSTLVAEAKDWYGFITGRVAFRAFYLHPTKGWRSAGAGR